MHLRLFLLFLAAGIASGATAGPEDRARLTLEAGC